MQPMLSQWMQPWRMCSHSGKFVIIFEFLFSIGHRLASWLAERLRRELADSVSLNFPSQPHLTSLPCTERHNNNAMGCAIMFSFC